MEYSFKALATPGEIFYAVSPNIAPKKIRKFKLRVIEFGEYEQKLYHLFDEEDKNWLHLDEEKFKTMMHRDIQEA